MSRNNTTRSLTASKESVGSSRSRPLCTLDLYPRLETLPIYNHFQLLWLILVARYYSDYWLPRAFGCGQLHEELKAS